MKYQTIIVSDLHLGTKDSKAEEFLEFIEKHPTHLLILNGDIIDGWALNRGAKWKKYHTKVISKLLKLSNKTKIIWIRGNHDEFVQEFIGSHFGNIEIKEDQLNGVWNRPGSGYSLWKRADVVYELDHVFPVNAGGTDGFENFQFLSANANAFVKCSLTYDDLLKRVDLSRKLKTRIRKVLRRRKKLFKSEKWKNWIDKVNEMESRIKKVEKV